MIHVLFVTLISVLQHLQQPFLPSTNKDSLRNSSTWVVAATQTCREQHATYLRPNHHVCVASSASSTFLHLVPASRSLRVFSSTCSTRTVTMIRTTCSTRTVTMIRTTCSTRTVTMIRTTCSTRTVTMIRTTCSTRTATMIRTSIVEAALDGFYYTTDSLGCSCRGGRGAVGLSYSRNFLVCVDM